MEATCQPARSNTNYTRENIINDIEEYIIKNSSKANTINTLSLYKKKDCRKNICCAQFKCNRLYY